MLIYIILLLLIMILGYLFLVLRKNRKLFLVGSFFLMWLVLSLRGPKVGEDTEHYIYVFNVIRGLSWGTVLKSWSGVVWDNLWGQKVEIGFGILNKVVGMFTDDGQVLLALVAALTCWLFGRFIYRNLPKHVFIATIVVLCDGFFMGAFNGIRQLLAVAIAVNAYEYVEKRETKKAAIIILVGFLIHNSAIAIIPFLILSQVKNKRLGIKYTAIGSAILAVGIPVLGIVISYVLPRYAVYFRINYWEANSLRGTLLLWAFEIASTVYILIKKNKLLQEEYIGIIGLITYIAIELIAREIVAIGRLTYYYRFFTMFLFSATGDKIHTNNKYIYYLMFFIIMILEYFSFARTPARLYAFFF